MDDDEGHVNGNFHKYYHFNPEQERLKFFTPQFLQSLSTSFSSSSIAVCDIGCNEGNVTVGMHRRLSGQGMVDETPSLNYVDHYNPDATSKLNNIIQRGGHELGVIITSRTVREDIHEYSCELYIDCVFHGQGVGTSKKVARARASHYALDIILTKRQMSCTRERPKREAESEAQMCFDVQTLGIDLDAKLITRAQEKYKDVDGLTFKVVDVMLSTYDAAFREFLKKQQKKKFDVITCFGLTMWIHLNHGDAELFSFLQKVSTWTDCLIIEPQPWKCYRNACRRLRRLNMPPPVAFSHIKHRRDIAQVIEGYLETDCGFQHSKLLGNTGWSRRIVLFSQKDSTAIN